MNKYRYKKEKKNGKKKKKKNRDNNDIDGTLFIYGGFSCLQTTLHKRSFPSPFN